MDNVATMSEKRKNDGILCLYHDKRWRNKIQFLLNQSKGKVIPPKYARKISLICPCNEKNSVHFEDHRAMTWKTLNRDLQKHTEDHPEFPTGGIHQQSPGHILLQILHSRCTESQESRWRLCVIYHCCINNKFSIFNSPSNTKIWKTKYETESTIELNYPGRITAFIFGRQGKHIKDICKENAVEILVKNKEQDVKLQKGLFRTFRFVSISAKSFDAVVRGHSQEAVQSAIKQLSVHVNQVQKRRESHEQNVLLFNEKRRLHLKRVSENRRAKAEYNALHGERLDPLKYGKFIASEDFARKYSKDIKEKQRRHLSKLSDEDDVTEWKAERRLRRLRNSHCKSCQLRFSSLEDMHSSRCRYHPGYLVSVNVEDGGFHTAIPSPSDADIDMSQGAFGDSDSASSPAEDMSTPGALQPPPAHYRHHKNHHRPGEGPTKYDRKKKTIETEDSDDFVSEESPTDSDSDQFSNESLDSDSGSDRFTTSANMPRNYGSKRFIAGSNQPRDFDSNRFISGSDQSRDSGSNRFTTSFDQSRNSGSPRFPPSTNRSPTTSPITTNSADYDEDGDSNGADVAAVNKDDRARFSDTMEVDESSRDSPVREPARDGNFSGAKVVKKWTCCDLIYLEGPRGCRLSRDHFNHVTGGCMFSRHYFVQGYLKKNKKQKGRKSAAPSVKRQYDL